MKKLFKNKYGYFDEDGSYVITKEKTPAPWINVISNGKYSLTISQAGGGFSWYIHSNFNRITRWFQDLIKDDWGKFIYIKDKKSGDIFSPTYQPTKVKFDSYKVKHSFGYTEFDSTYKELAMKYTIFVPIDDSLEVWILRIKNKSKETKSLSIYSYFEWALGDAPDNHREFFKTFIETEFKNDMLLARKRLWNVDSRNRLNRNWDYIAFHTLNSNINSYDTDKINFIGKYGTIEKPEGLFKGLKKKTGKYLDPVGILQKNITIKSGEEKEVIFLLGLSKDIKEINRFKKYYYNSQNVYKELNRVKEFWNNIFSRLEIKTPDNSFNLFVNKWLKYQAISGRLWGRAAYYQQSGAYGFRDQLQDSQIFLPIVPELTKRQILLHAEHQFSDGSVLHWWHPIAEEGLKNDISDNLLWLPFMVYRYLLETDDFSILNIIVKYYDKGKGTLYQHCLKAFEKVRSRISKRFIPLIGEGDWNDGMNAVGKEWKGESFWLGMFYFYILDNWKYIFKKKNDKVSLKKYTNIKNKLYESLNKYGWDGEWYRRATTDTGKIIGSKKNKEGKIFLNSQTWSIITNIAPKKRVEKIVKSVEKYLIKNNGALLFYPAFKTPDTSIGYLTRYAPGVRENGGVYFHAATWMLWVYSILNESEKLYKLYKKMSPILKNFANPDLYKAEPYVTPGNIDGVDSPYYGKAGWTWYTGSAAWFFTMLSQELIGIKPDWEGLKFEPEIPKEWKEVSVVRYFRGAKFDITMRRNGKGKNIEKIIVNDKEINYNIIKPEKDKEYKVIIYLK